MNEKGALVLTGIPLDDRRKVADQLLNMLVHLCEITLRPRFSKIGPFEIFPLLRNFFVFRYFPLTAMLNYLTYQVFYITYIKKK